jgi:hypothetical protein
MAISANSQAPRMPAALRISVKAVATMLALSGCLWLVLHFLFPEQGDFGLSPNRWEPPVMRVHGLVAIAGVFLFGWIMSKHVIDAWPQPKNRVSGLLLTSALLVLAASGYALYYLSNEFWQGAVAATHEVLGSIAMIMALVHWSVVRR